MKVQLTGCSWKKEVQLEAATSVVADHPNKMKLTGVLVRLDEPSTKAPNGSQGHRILVPKDVATKRLNTLVGMGLNYAPSLEAHAQRRKVGVINKAWITGSDVWVEATVWKHDFPEAERDLKQKGLGMSMEIGDVEVEDETASVWHLSDFCFLGATVLYKDAAAYYRTHAIAAAMETVKRSTTMAVTKKIKGQALTPAQIAKIAAEAAVGATEPLQEMLASQNKTITKQTEILAAISGRLEAMELEDELEQEEIAAGAGAQVDEMDTCDKPMKAAKKKEPPAEEDDDDNDDNEDDDEMESSLAKGEVDKGDLDDLGTAEDDDEDDDDPGHLNKGTKNHGSDTTLEDKVGPNINKAVTGAAVKVLRKKVASQSATIAQLRAEQDKMKKQMSRMTKQMSAAAQQTERRSVPAEIQGILAKNGIDANEITASGKKLTAIEWDGMMQTAGLGGLDVVKRMTLKNQLLQAGMLDEGRVNRGYRI